MNPIMQELLRQNSVQFIVANEMHVNDIAEIEKENFSDPLKSSFISQELTTNPFAVYYVILIDENVVGYIGCRLIDDICEVLNIAIKKAFQQLGYGTSLLTYVMKDMKSRGIKHMILDVRKSNEHAKHLYEKLGFKHMHTRRHYYKNNEDALVYKKEIR